MKVGRTIEVTTAYYLTTREGSDLNLRRSDWIAAVKTESSIGPVGIQDPDRVLESVTFTYSF